MTFIEMRKGFNYNKRIDNQQLIRTYDNELFDSTIQINNKTMSFNMI